MSRPQGRLAELDALRGLAALGVVFHHAWLLVPRTEGDGLAPLGWLLDETPLRVLGAGRPAVIFFFVLSGYVLVLSLRRRPLSWPSYALQRSIRLALPVAASVLLSWAFWAIAWNGPLPEDMGDFAHATWREPPTPAAALRQAALLNTDDANDLNPVLWSLVHEWRIALLMPALLLAGSRAWAPPLLGLLAFAAALALGVPMDGGGLGADLGQTLLSSLYFILPFAVGAGLALGLPLRRDLAPGERLAAGAAILLAMAASQHDLVAIAGSVLLILLASQPGGLGAGLRRPALLWLGRMSFSLYLIHMPVMMALLHLLHDVLPLAVILALTLPVALIAAWLLHGLAEAPAQSIARLAAERWFPAEAATAPAATGRRTG